MCRSPCRCLCVPQTCHRTLSPRPRIPSNFHLSFLPNYMGSHLLRIPRDTGGKRTTDQPFKSPLAIVLCIMCVFKIIGISTRSFRSVNISFTLRHNIVFPLPVYFCGGVQLFGKKEEGATTTGQPPQRKDQTKTTFLVVRSKLGANENSVH